MNKLIIEAIPPTIYQHAPFNMRISQIIAINQAVTVYDTSTKANQMGGYYIILNKDIELEIKHEMYDKL